MFTSNPFATLTEVISPAMMQGYIVLMVLLVMGGTILDMLHKKSATYFFENAKKAKKSAKRSVSGGEKVAMAVGVLTNEVMTAGEFSNPQRRISHLLMMYGFIMFAVTVLFYISMMDGILSPRQGLFFLLLFFLYTLIRLKMRFEFRKLFDFRTYLHAAYHFNHRGHHFQTKLVLDENFRIF